MKLPKARTKDIVVQEAGTELLIYDLTTHNAYALNETLNIVYQTCDGISTFAKLQQKYHFTDDLIYYSLDELEKYGLLESDYHSPLKGLSRRTVIKKIGLTSMAALPIIFPVMVPVSTQAQSGCSAPGTISSAGCSNGDHDCNQIITILDNSINCCSKMGVSSPGTPCPNAGVALPACVCA